MIVRGLALLLFSVFLTLVVIRPSYAQGVSCQDIALDPKSGDGVRVLKRFYVRTGDVGGLGCWFHSHPNGKDGLVTPFGWGRRPGPERLEVIDTIFEVITEARQKLSRLGFLDNALFVVLRDTWTGDEGEAYWPNDEQCWMEDRLSRDSVRGSERSLLRGIIAHEIGHCFIMENIDGYSPSTFQDSLDYWWDESGAEYYSTIVYPELNHEHSYARAFSLDLEPFTQPYNAYVVFAHYAQLYGADSVLELLRNIFAQRSNAALLSYLRDQGFDSFFHDFAVTHFSMKVVDSGGGFIPRDGEVRAALYHWLGPDRRFTTLPDLDGSRLNVIELNIPAGYSLEISSPVNQSLGLFVSLQFENDLVRNWISPYFIEANCDQERVLKLLTTHLRDAPIKNLKLAYLLEHNPNCGICVPKSKKIRKYGPDGVFGNPDYVPRDHLEAKAICKLSCEYRCLCGNRSLWEDRPVTEAECLSVHPSGADPMVTGSSYTSPTVCKAYANGMSAEDLLDTACTVRCVHNCTK